MEHPRHGALVPENLGELAAFDRFDPTLDAACEAAQRTDGPVLIMASSRLDGTVTCTDH